MSVAPEKIWAFHAGPMVGLFISKAEYGTNVAEYIRADLAEARIKAAVEAEREKCAQAAEGFEQTRIWAPGSFYDTLRRECAAAIRARSKP